MSDSLADSLRAIVPYIKPQLIAPEALSHIRTIADLFPAIPTVSQAIFECRLGRDAAEADFSLCITSSNRGMLTDRSARNLPETVFANSVWKTIRNFSWHWSDPNSSLHENITNIWLEFDVDRSSPTVPEPSFFFAPKRLTDSSTSQWVREALSLLGTFLTPKIEENLLNCFNLLPSGAQVAQIGVMLSREAESRVVRLCLRNILPEQIGDYLIAVGWAGSVKELQETVTALAGFTDKMMLNFAVGNMVLPKLGVECYFQRKPFREPRLEEFLDYLVEKQLCTPGKRDALVAWSGISHEKSHRERWPQDLLTTSDFLGSRKLSMFVRLLNHIKIVYQPHQLEAKAYLWFGHKWVDLP